MSALVNVSKNGTHKNNGLANRTWSNWVDDLFGIDPFPSVISDNFNTGLSLPKVNVKETKDDYFLELAVPGLKKEDFNIDIDNELLTISAEIKVEDEKADDNYTRKEFSYSSFKKTFTLPDSIDEAKIKAKYEAGVLNVHLPKREEAKPKPARTIKIS
ncbi:Hsp20/alpha crystallin family protein [Flavobacteriaceae bacterium MHTCC 0001]